PTTDEVENYTARHMKRLNVKPGMTGEWQANGRSSVTDFDKIVEMDINYQDKWSLSYDIQLIVKTIFVVLNRSGAC
ncbi:MAG: sugar transferase, partial [Geitlerinemataceae cyanobacterium]